MKNALRYASILAFTLSSVHAQFKFTALGSLPGSGPTPVVHANGMNSAGHVCGSSSYLDTTHAFLWKPFAPNGPSGAMFDLGAPIHPTSTNWSICTAVSTWAPVGYGYYPLLMSYRALVFAGETFIGATTAVPYVLPIPETPPTFVANSYANSVNDAGVIAGSWTPSAGIYHAMVWHAVGPTAYAAADLNSPGFTGWVLNIATGVNKAGDVVGYGSFKGVTHGFLLSKGAIADLGSLAPGTPADFSVATGLNDKGQVVGYSSVITPKGVFHHAFLWSSGIMKDLGAPVLPGVPTTTSPLTALGLAPTGPMPFTNSIAVAINNNGKIVGWANMAPVASMLYEKTAYGWGTAVAYDTNPGAVPPELVTGWNILSMPSVTTGAAPVPPGLPPGGPPPISSMVAAFAINDFDQIGGVYLSTGPLLSGYLLTAPLPLKR
jgi:probable HAF family extracellular repeat protein